MLCPAWRSRFGVGYRNSAAVIGGFVFALTFVSCGPSRPLNEPPRETFAGVHSNEPPLTLEIVGSTYLNNRLNVKAKLAAKDGLSSDQVVLSLVGLKDGKIVGRSLMPLNQIAPGSIDPGSEIVAMLALESPGLSDFQVRASWGDDALRLTAPGDNTSGSLRSPSIVPALDSSFTGDGPSSVALESITVESEEQRCSKQPCDILYTVSGDIVNDGEKVVDRLELACGLFWETAGRQAKLPDPLAPIRSNEVRRPLANLNLKPGERQRVRIRIEQPVPVVPGGRFVPHLRVSRLD